MVAPLATRVNDSIVEARAGAGLKPVWDLAILYHANGYTERAELAYKWLLTQESDAKAKARLNYSLAAIQREHGNVESAREYLEESVSLYSQYSLSHFYLAETRYKMGDVQGAADSYEATLALDPEDAFAQLGLARIKLQQGEKEKAVSMLEALLEEDPDNFNGRSLLAQIFSRMGERERAAALRVGSTTAWEAPREDPWLEPVAAAVYDVQRLGFRFEDYKRVRDYKRAFEYLDRIESIAPQKADTYLLRGRLYSELGNLEEAGQSYRKGIESGGDLNVLYPLLVDTLLKRGREAEAEAIAREGVSKASDSPKVHSKLANICFDKGELEEARSLLDRSLALDPYDVEALLLDVRISFRSGTPEKAAASVELLQQLASSNVSVLVMLGLLHMEAGLFADALPILEAAFRVAPDNADVVELRADAHFQLGRLAAANGQLDESLSRFEKALAINPRNDEALLGQVQVFANLKRFGEAEIAARKLLKLKPADVGLLLSFGDLLFANGKREEARGAWERALGLSARDPQMAQAARLRLQRTQ